MSETTAYPNPADIRASEHAPVPALRSQKLGEVVKHGRMFSQDLNGNLVLSNEADHIQQHGPELHPTSGHSD